jgi:uncharacterized membrane protein YebE (DUF533 family)
MSARATCQASAVADAPAPQVRLCAMPSDASMPPMGRTPAPASMRPMAASGSRTTASTSRPASTRLRVAATANGVPSGSAARPPATACRTSLLTGLTDHGYTLTSSQSGITTTSYGRIPTMAFKDMLDQMLTAGKDLAAKGGLDDMIAQGKEMAAHGGELADKHLSLPPAGPERDAMLGNLGKGALAGGALVALLGTGAGRKLTGTAAALGGIGLLGKVAYDAFQTWRGDQGKSGEPGTPVHQLPGAAAEDRSKALFKAMIAAAKADGHVDDAERAAIQTSIASLGLDDDTKLMMETELARPLDVQDIAAGADSPEAAAEIYLASLFVIDTANPNESAYLEQLATALDIQPALAEQLRTKAQAA